LTGIPAPQGARDALAPGSAPASAVAVSTVNQVLKDIVEGAFLPLWIRGEVSDFKRHRNGHWYFTLRDRSAQLRCVAWASDQRRIPAAPDDGMLVTVFGQMTIYAARGDVHFSVRRMEAEGDGLWRKALERTRARLESDGLLAPERKRQLPAHPQRIAVITSLDGAALHDIIHVLRRRAPSVSIVIVPARVQGDGAAKELTAAVKRVARWRGADLLIIGRGGGAREDLWSFNDESLARALAASPLPTISAVGHEVDTTICDLVADYRAATPSAAAEAAVPASADLGAHLRSAAQHLQRSVSMAVRVRTERVATARRRLPYAVTRLVDVRAARIRALAGRIHALSPLSVMARGYGIAQGRDGRTLSRIADFSGGEEFRLRLQDGSVDATAHGVSRNAELEGDVV
jgi:exodeoxyribonuclease VII large subunit